MIEQNDELKLEGVIDLDTIHKSGTYIIALDVNNPSPIKLSQDSWRSVKELQDSGDRTQFETGAVRDMHEGKGRCDLLPACAVLRLAKHYENGANKYSDRNWEKGIPTSVMLDSGMRHLLKYLDGWIDEDHLAAAAWNILGAMWMEEKHPELQNIPSRPDCIKMEDK